MTTDQPSRQASSALPPPMAGMGSGGTVFEKSCPACLATNAIVNRFCAFCGHRFEADDTAALSPEQAEPSPEPLQKALQHTQDPLPLGATTPSREPTPSMQAEPSPGPAEASPEPLSALPTTPTRFAQMSIELMNFVQLAASVQDPSLIDRCRQECLARIEAMAAQAQGVVESVRNNILFITFPRQATLEASVQQAIAMACQVVEEPLLFHQLPLKIRIGLDIEDADDRQPMTSAMERSVASPGMVVISEQACACVAEVYTVEPIGPIRIGEGLRTFYRVLKPRHQALPDAAIVEDPVQATPVNDTPAEPDPALPPPAPQTPGPEDFGEFSGESPGEPSEPGPEAEPDDDDVFGVLFPSASPPPAQTASPSSAAPAEPTASASFVHTLGEAASASGADVSPPEDLSRQAPPADHAIMAAGFSPAALPADAAMATLGMMGSAPPPSAMASAALPEPTLRDGSQRLATGYCPPLFGERRTPSAANARYEAGVDTLIRELRGFIEDPAATGRIVTLSANDGVGKSYILNNLLLRALAPDPRQPGMIWFQGTNYRSLGARGLPLMLWLEMFHNALPMMLEGSDPQSLQGWLSHTLNHIYRGQVPPEVLRFWGQFFLIQPLGPIALDTLDGLGDIARYMHEFIAHMAQQLPVVIVIDDADQADAASMNLLVSMIENGLLRHRVCVLLTYDRTFSPLGRLEQAIAQHATRQISLSDLNQEEIVSFLSSGPFAGTLETLSSQHIDDLMTYSGGRSIYLFEAIAYLQISQVFWVNPQTGKLAPNPNVDQTTLSVPATLEDMIRVRYEGLSAEQRYVLQVASVLGERFTLKTLVDLCQFDIDTMQRILEHLTVQQFIVSDFQLTGHFRHRMLWDLVYQTMEPALRTDLHKLASEYLETLVKNRITVNPLLCALQAEYAQLPNRAFHYWNLAGVWCTHLGDPVGLNLAFARALALLQAQPGPQTADLIARLQCNLGMLNLDDAPELAVSLLEQAVAHAQAQGDPPRQLEAQGYLAAAYEAMGSLQQAHDVIEKSLTLLPADTSPQERAILQVSRLGTLYRLGRLEKTRAHLASDIAVLDAQPEALGDPALAEAVLSARLLHHELDLWQCRPIDADRLSNTLALSEERGFTALAMALKLTRLRGLLWQGVYDGAERLLHGLLPEIEALPQPDELLGQWGLLAMTLHLEKGDWKSAEDLTLHSLLKAEQAHDFYTWILIQAEAARMALAQGRADDARTLAEAMAAESSERRLATCALTCWRLLAEAQSAQGQHDVALDMARRALAIADKPDVVNTRQHVLLTLAMARILLASGDIRGAGEQLQPLWPRIKQTPYLPLIADTASAIGELYLAMAQRLPEGVQRIQHQERAMRFFEIAMTQWQQLRNPYQLGLVSARVPAL